MQSSESENSSSNAPEVVAKPKQVRTKRAIRRYNEDGTYNNKPSSPTYFKYYYR